MNSLLRALKEAGVKNPSTRVNMAVFRSSLTDTDIFPGTLTITGDNIPDLTVSVFDIWNRPYTVIDMCVASIRKESKHKRNLPDWF